MYITRIHLENIRSFDDLDLDITGDDGKPRMRTLIIGENATGKTTLLRSIALGLASRADVNALAAEPLAGKLRPPGGGKSRITINLLDNQDVPYEKRKLISDDNGIEIITEPDTEGDTQAPRIFLCGYGVGRSNEGVESGRDYRIADSAYTLFSYEATLVQTELVLRRLRDFLKIRRYRRAMEGIKRGLGLTSRDEINLPEGWHGVGSLHWE